MRPGIWHPPIELSQQEHWVVKRIKRAKLFTFLRQYRHQLFSQEFQEELSQLYADSAKGHPPISPAQLALVTILQAYTGASDAEAIEALIMDRRWQLVVDCIDCEQAPFSQATLARFRKTAFVLDWDNNTICCPNQVTLPFTLGGKGLCCMKQKNGHTLSQGNR